MSFLRARRFIAGAVIALFAAAATHASAKVITLDATLDLTKALTNAHGVLAGEVYGWGAALPLSATVEVAVGDTFNYNLRFAGDQALHIQDFWIINPNVWTPGYGQISAATVIGTIDFIAPDGSIVASGAKTSNEGAANNIGQFLPSIYFSLLPSDFTMIGFNYSEIVVDYDNKFQKKTFNGPSLHMTYEFGEIVSVARVPEAPTWTMMLTLFGVAAGVAARARRVAWRTKCSK
jgi:hypothetical protein